MQEPKSFSEGLSNLRDIIVVSQGDALTKEQLDKKSEYERKKNKLEKDIMSQIQKRKDNKYIAFQFPKNADKPIKRQLLEEICKTFSINARLYVISQRDKKSCSAKHITAPIVGWDGIKDFDTWILIDNRRPESISGNITISTTDIKKALK